MYENTLITYHDGENKNVAAGLFAIADSIRYLGDTLGTNNSSSNMGALELLSKEVHDGFEQLGNAIARASYDHR